MNKMFREKVEESSIISSGDFVHDIIVSKEPETVLIRCRIVMFINWILTHFLN